MQADPVTPNAFGDRPNVSGEIYHGGYINAVEIWAFTRISTTGDGVSRDLNGDFKTLTTSAFSTATSNSIYGSNTKVQPRSFYALMIIKA